MNYNNQDDVRAVSNLYQSISKEQPSALLDEKILSQSKSKSRDKRSYRLRKLSVAASFLMLISTTYLVVKQPNPLEHEESAYAPIAEQTEVEIVLSDSIEGARTAQLSQSKLAPPTQQVELARTRETSLYPYPDKTIENELSKLVEQYKRLTLNPKLTEQDKTRLELIQKQVFTHLTTLRKQHPGIAINPAHLAVLTKEQQIYLRQ